MTLRTHVDSRGYDHAALLYQSEREYVDRLVNFIGDEGGNRLVLNAILDNKMQPVWFKPF